MKKIVIACLIAGLILSPGISSAGSKGRVFVGGKTFTEQFILARILTLLFQAEGYEVEEKVNLESGVCRKALVNKETDIYWEYTGTGYRVILSQNDPQVYTDPEKLYAQVKSLDLKENGIVWLNKSSANNTYGLAVKREFAEAHQLENLSDLSEMVKKKGKVVFGIGKVFYERPEGFKRLQAYYDFKAPRPDVKIIVNKAIYPALNRGQIQAGMVFGTDAQIRQYDLIVLKDDRGFFPVYNPAPTLREEFLKKHPGIGELADKVGPLLDDESLIQLNYQYDFEKQDLDQIARNWLQKEKLLK